MAHRLLKARPVMVTPTARSARWLVTAGALLTLSAGCEERLAREAPVLVEPELEDLCGTFVAHSVEALHLGRTAEPIGATSAGVQWDDAAGVVLVQSAPRVLEVDPGEPACVAMGDALGGGPRSSWRAQLELLAPMPVLAPDALERSVEGPRELALELRLTEVERVRVDGDEIERESERVVVAGRATCEQPVTLTRAWNPAPDALAPELQRIARRDAEGWLLPSYAIESAGVSCVFELEPVAVPSGDATAVGRVAGRIVSRGEELEVEYTAIELL